MTANLTREITDSRDTAMTCPPQPGLYLRKMNATPEERKEVMAWVRDGNDFMTNGDYIYDEFGHPADYITASRAMDEICAHFAAMTPEELAEEFYWRHPSPDDLVKD